MYFFVSQQKGNNQVTIAGPILGNGPGLFGLLRPAGAANWPWFLVANKRVPLKSELVFLYIK